MSREDPGFIFVLLSGDIYHLKPLKNVESIQPRDLMTVDGYTLKSEHRERILVFFVAGIEYLK